MLRKRCASYNKKRLIHNKKNSKNNKRNNPENMNRRNKFHKGNKILDSPSLIKEMKIKSSVPHMFLEDNLMWEEKKLL